MKREDWYLFIVFTGLLLAFFYNGSPLTINLNGTIVSGGAGVVIVALAVILFYYEKKKNINAR
jgi:pilus assembly protein TadC